MIVLYIYLTVALVGSLITCLSLLSEDNDVMFSSPKEVYDTFITLNWFGATTVFIIMVLTAPIPYFFYFTGLLLTIGRK